METTPDTMSMEQAAEWQALQGMAQEDETSAVTAPAEDVPDLAEEIAGALLMAASVAAPVFPSLGQIYDAPTCERVGSALAPVCKKHGWLTDGIGGQYKEELLAIAVIAPLGIATYNGIKTDLERKKKKPEPQQGTPAPVMGERLKLKIGGQPLESE